MEEQGYLDLLARLLQEGEERIGRNGKTYSLFGETLKFDLTTGFPVFTTKRVFWRGVVEELLWFLRGSTDATELSAKGVHIWDDNTTSEFQASVGLGYLRPGLIGAGYGHQWRAFNGAYDGVGGGDGGGDNVGSHGGVDQIRYLLKELTANPYGRRAILSAWNPCQLDQAVLPPCHVLYEFYISKTHGLSCMMIQRSADICAGEPFNVASTALLTTLLAHLLHIPAHRVIVNIGDAHVYDEHVEGASEQAHRVPYSKPHIQIVREAPSVGAPIDELVRWLETLKYEDIVLSDYKCHPAIKYKMIA